MPFVKTYLSISLLFLFLFIAIPKVSSAATFTVSKTADTNDGTCDADCSLREAIVAANANAGFDTINFNIPTSDGGYAPPSGSVQGYFTITTTTLLSITDNSGVFINGYSQPGASRNTAAFGTTLNTVLKIQLFTNFSTTDISIAGNNTHISGLNIRTLRTGSGSINMTSSNNWIEGNYIGSDITGTASMNGGGIFLIGASNNIIGTNGDGSGDLSELNLFLGSSANYISISNSGNVIAGNYLGVDRTSRVCTTGALSAQAVELLSGSSNNRVGTNYDGISDSTESNIIGCVNTSQRAELRLSGTSGSTIQGNYVGTNTYGDNLATALGARGVLVIRDGQNTNNVIKKNFIAFAPDGSAGNGIQMLTSSPISSGNTFSQNSVYGNASLGIGINNGNSVPLANDAGDVDTGSNDLMNYPVLKKVSKNGNSLIVVADLDFKASEGPFTIELFDNDALDSSGYGEGQYFVGSTTTSTIGSNVTLTIPITGRTPVSASKITSTATNVNGSTSEFSAASADPTLYIISESSPGPNMPSAPGCGAAKPGSSPELFQINSTNSSSTLNFTPVNDNISSYYIAYGFSEGDQRFGVQFDSGRHDGVVSYTINDLAPNTTYYYQVRAGNGCQPGEFSNWLKAITPKGKLQTLTSYLYDSTSPKR